LGEKIVAGKRGLIGETISMVSIDLPFPQGRANWRRCPSGYLRDGAPATAALRK
jgi:hypothetical protein